MPNPSLHQTLGSAQWRYDPAAQPPAPEPVWSSGYYGMGQNLYCCGVNTATVSMTNPGVWRVTYDCHILFANKRSEEVETEECAMALAVEWTLTHWETIWHSASNNTGLMADGRPFRP